MNKDNAEKIGLAIIRATEEEESAGNLETNEIVSRKAVNKKKTEAEIDPRAVSALIRFFTFFELAFCLIIFTVNLIFRHSVWQAVAFAGKYFFWWNSFFVAVLPAVIIVAMIVALLVILITCQESPIEILIGWLATIMAGLFSAMLTGVILINFFLRNIAKAFGSYLAWQAGIGIILWPSLIASQTGQFWAGIIIVILAAKFFD